jgi:hypothetical protein
MNQSLAPQILNQVVACNVAHQRQVLICKPLVCRAAGHLLSIVVGVKMNGQEELALGALAVGAACPLLGSNQGRQKQRGQNADYGNYSQQFDERESAFRKPQHTPLVLLTTA